MTLHPRQFRFAIVVLSILMLGLSSEERFRVFLVGDSTMADKPIIDNPEHGWGQMIPALFSHNITWFNQARNGRSTRSFIMEGRWNTVLAQLRPGDYVFIQFGHNDSKKEDTARFAAPQTDYRQNLLRMVFDVRARNGNPVLLTPVNRRKYDANGVFVDQHGEYPAVVRAVAKEQNIPLIDLHESSRILLEQAGPEGSKGLFLTSVQPGIYHALPNGKDDNTHFTRTGALQIARLVADGIRELDLPLCRMLLAEASVRSEGRGRVIGLDEYFNNEWRKGKDTALVRYHYVWDDTTNSGFSVLGSIADRQGADLDTLQGPPTRESLKRFSVYIIVDPDNEKETPSPHFVLPEHIDAIESWVKDGGVLLLLGNDKGNMEFIHFNTLAGRFGFRFVEETRRDVINNQYDMGRITDLPRHPLFEGVNGLFIKQWSGLSLQGAARPILTDQGAVVIAEASVGRGYVFAVGDPWLYNEYIDNRRLPAGYENFPAAGNVISWLLTKSIPVRSDKRIH